MPDIPNYKFVLGFARLVPDVAGSYCWRASNPREPGFDLQTYYCALCEDHEVVIAPIRIYSTCEYTKRGLVVPSNLAGAIGPAIIAPTHDDAALMIPATKILTLRSRNHLDQNYELSSHRLILDGGVGAQQLEAENAVEDEQAVDVWFLTVTMVEKRYVDAEHLSDLLELRRADPADALLVFLHLLKGKAEVSGQLCLRDACFPATETDSPPHLDVRDPGRSWAELLG